MHCIFRLRALRYRPHWKKYWNKQLPTTMLVNCLVFFTVLFFPGHNCTPQTLLLISLDGFRWDFAGKAHTPYLEFLKETGVTVPYVRSVFPTATMPGHCSIVTGLYPESHGIISNTMYDPVLKARFDAAQTDPRWWNVAEPIWVTNQSKREQLVSYIGLGKTLKLKACI